MIEFITGKKTYVGDINIRDPKDVMRCLQLYRWNDDDVYCSRVKIGSYCSIALGIQFMCGGFHPVDSISTYPFYKDYPQVGYHCNNVKRPDIIIGNDVYIGQDMKILAGVNIGDGAVIGAFSVVTHDVEPYTIVGGNPAKVIRKRFSDEIIAELLELKWWDCPDDVIEKIAPYMMERENFESNFEKVKEIIEASRA